MKQIKIITILLILISISATTSAEIKFRTTSSMMPRYKSRTYTPQFDLNKTKHNTRIEQIGYKSNNQPASYITEETHQNRKQQRLNIYGSTETSYYRQYTPTGTTTQNLSFNQHTTIKTYNPANNQPFNDGNAVIKTGPTQYAYGPPAEGPVSDVIIPLLLFVSLYIVAIKRNIRQ